MYYEKNKTPEELAFSEMIKKQNIYLTMKTTALKLSLILELNEKLGIVGSYDITTIITKDKLIGMKDYIITHYKQIREVFCLKQQIPKEMNDVTKVNSFLFQTIFSIYFNFNGNTFGASNKVSNRNRNDLTYCFKGLDLGRIIKKNVVKVPENKDDLFDFEEDTAEKLRKEKFIKENNKKQTTKP